MAITLRLKELRKNAKMTQTDVANLLGVTREAYAMYEAGKRQVSIEVLDKLAEYYGLSIDYLVGRTESDDLLEDLTYDEKQLLINYRSLDQRGQKTVMSLIKIEVQLS